MCVIVSKPKHAPFPSLETLRNCWNSNPDGAGFMVADGERVIIRKGFMEFEDFTEALELARYEFGDGAAYVLHFRIATHGAVTPELCHPFPLSPSVDDMRAIECTTMTGIAHNGIIPNRSTSSTVSDTMDYIASFIYPLSELIERWQYDANARRLITDTLESKLAVLTPDGELSYFGHFERFDGCLFSNDSYMGYDLSDPCDGCANYEYCNEYGFICIEEPKALPASLYSIE